MPEAIWDDRADRRGKETEGFRRVPALFFIITNSRAPYIEPGPFMTFLASHISFLPPSYACKRSKRNPLILKFVATFGVF